MTLMKGHYEDIYSCPKCNYYNVVVRDDHEGMTVDAVITQYVERDLLNKHDCPKCGEILNMTMEHNSPGIALDIDTDATRHITLKIDPEGDKD